MSDNNTPNPEGNPVTGGSDFKDITSQEDLDKIVSSRLKREREKYSDYEEVKEKAGKFDEVNRQLTEAQEKLSSYEAKDQVAVWAKEVVKGSTVPAGVLRGKTKEELEEHFDQLKPAYTKETAPNVPGDGEPPADPPATGDWLREALNG